MTREVESHAALLTRRAVEEIAAAAVMSFRLFEIPRPGPAAPVAHHGVWTGVWTRHPSFLA